MSIIEACIARNQNAQSVLYRQFFGYAKSVCLRYSSNQNEAKEILNEGFLKVFNNLEKYSSEFPFKAWLRTIMVNTAINYYRNNKKYSRLPAKVLLSRKTVAFRLQTEQIFQT